MSEKGSNIYPVFDWILLRNSKEKLLNQHALVIWMSGLSGAGKSTLAAGLERELFKRNYLTQIIDGDNVRTGLNRNLSFTDEDRKENLRRIAELSKLFINCGVITINSFISPTNESREQRDSKGLYKKARQGLIKNFTGIDSSFEPPENPDIEIRTNLLNIDEGVDKLMNYVLPIVKYKK